MQRSAEGRTMRFLWQLLKQAFDEWSEDRVPRLAAALSYYTTFSLAPLLILVIGIAGVVFGTDAVQGSLDNQLRGLLGDDGAKAIQEIVQNANKNSGSGFVASALSLGALLLGATGVFGELQDSLNTIWEVKPKAGRGIRGLVRDRILSFGMVLAIAFLLIVSLVVSAVLSGIGTFMGGLMPGSELLGHALDIVVSIAILTLLFATIFKWLPDVILSWRDVWIGAAATSVLFTIGKLLIGLYLGRGSVTSVYGAAGSLVVVLVWVYYSAQILFFGAELTQVYANQYGSHVLPAHNAEPVTEEARAQQGMPRRPDMREAPATTR
jgi:membrane protein